MPTIAQQLTQLESDRSDLVDNLETKGITGLSGDETFTELVPEVLNIPSGSGGLDWSEIGYSETPQGIVDIFNYSKQLKDTWTSRSNPSTHFSAEKELIIAPLVTIYRSMTNLSQMFFGCENLKTIPTYLTANVTNMYQMFCNCYKLPEIPLLDTSSVTNMQGMFYTCSKITNIPQLNTANVTNFQDMCRSCTSLVHIPIFNTSSATNMKNMFSATTNLDDTSVDNILQMCINATSYSGTKTLYQLGLRSGYYPASRVQALPHYQDFVNAGWSTGL